MAQYGPLKRPAQCTKCSGARTPACSVHTLETHRNSLILRDEFFGRRLQCGTGLPACQRLTCVAPGTAIQVSPPNERRRPSAQVASQKPSCFVGQPILAANPGCSRLSPSCDSLFLPQETFPSGIVYRSCERAST